jgi:hypothetical protein
MHVRSNVIELLMRIVGGKGGGASSNAAYWFGFEARQVSRFVAAGQAGENAPYLLDDICMDLVKKRIKLAIKGGEPRGGALALGLSGGVVTWYADPLSRFQYSCRWPAGRFGGWVVGSVAAPLTLAAVVVHTSDLSFCPAGFLPSTIHSKLYLKAYKAVTKNPSNFHSLKKHVGHGMCGPFHMWMISGLLSTKPFSVCGVTLDPCTVIHKVIAALNALGHKEFSIAEAEAVRRALDIALAYFQLLVPTYEMNFTLHQVLPQASAPYVPQPI